MHGFWLEFEQSLEEEYLSARAHQLQRRYRHAVCVACAFRGVVVLLTFKHDSTVQFLSWLHLLLAAVEVCFWTWDYRRLVEPSAQRVVAVLRIMNAAFWCYLSPFSLMVSLNQNAPSLSTILSGIMVHGFPIVMEQPFRIALPSQIVVTVICLLLEGRGVCKNGFGGMDLSLTQGRMEAMFLVFETKHPTCCLHVFMVIHTFLGSVVVPYIVWCRELYSRLQFLNDIPEDRRPPGARFLQKIPTVIRVMHVVVMVYGFSLLSKCIGKSPLPDLLGEWGWCRDC
ncbi:hypothetical protein BSKO_00851 [Bryopsis sp. KO-2023]|nr:hypothetical protein BSKO_00851 [Bryopsis sp. KO-2023]